MDTSPWTLRPRQAPLSMGFPRQEYWSGLPFPPPGDLPDPGIEPTSSTSQVALVVKNPLANEGDSRDAGLIPGSGRLPGGGNGNPLQHCGLENSTDRRPWWAVHEVPESQTWLSTHTLLRWEADSSPLSHQGSPSNNYIQGYFRKGKQKVYHFNTAKQNKHFSLGNMCHPLALNRDTHVASDYVP